MNLFCKLENILNLQLILYLKFDTLVCSLKWLCCLSFYRLFNTRVSLSQIRRDRIAKVRTWLFYTDVLTKQHFVSSETQKQKYWMLISIRHCNGCPDKMHWCLYSYLRGMRQLAEKRQRKFTINKIQVKFYAMHILRCSVINIAVKAILLYCNISTLQMHWHVLAMAPKRGDVGFFKNPSHSRCSIGKYIIIWH